MATLKEIQNCELEILKTVADICDKHGIKYYLAFGTLLGAVRHKGFIPWDDDVDILMQYNDLVKFKKICKKELPDKYFFQDFETDPGFSFMFTKIRANNTYMPQFGEKSKSITYHQGVWIDIFPLIDYGSNEQQTLKIVKYLFKLQYTLVRRINIKKKYFNSLKHKIIGIATNELKFKPLSRYYLRKIISLQDKNSHKFLIISNAYWGESTPEKIKYAMSKRSLDKRLCIPKLINFEKYKFIGFKDFDLYLKHTYGDDYMTPKKYPQHIVDDYSKVVIN